MEAHHVREKLCTSRAKYRQGRELKAVKTYTVAQESQYILVLGLPAIHIQDKLVKSMGKFGTIIEWRHLKDYTSEEFTETILFKYQRIQSARAAKRKTDDKSFYGGVLHVCYAPEYETIDEVRKKLKDRQLTYCRRLKQLEQEKASEKYRVRSSLIEENGDGEEIEDTEETVSEAALHQTDSHHHPTNQGSYTSQHGNPMPVQQTFPLALPPPPCNIPPPPPPFPPQTLYNPRLPQNHMPLPQGGQQNYQPPQGGNITPRFNNAMNGCPGNNGDGTTHNSSQYTRSFPLAGPAPPCGPFIPSGYKTTEKTDSKGRKRNWQSHPNPRDSCSNPTPSVSQPIISDTNVVIKEYKPPKESSKFVPRQVSKVSLPKHLTTCDPVSDTLRKNALTLKATVAGPSLPPEDEQEHETKRAMKRKDPAMEKVMQNIRDRVKQFTEKAMLPPQLKKKKHM